MNVAIFIGRCTRKPEVKYTPTGTAVCTFGIAVPERFKKGDEWVERVDFFDVVIFGKRGEAFAKYHDKGALCSLSGRMKQDTWDDKQTGQKRSKVSMHCNEWFFVGGGKKEQDAQPQQSSSPDFGGGWDVPADTPF